LIGRHVDCDVRLESPKISRRHCCLAIAYDRVLIRDLGSRNGVRVNGQLRQEARLQPGDELAIGPILFRFELESNAPLDASARPARGATVSSAGRPTTVAPGVKAAAPQSSGSDADIDLVPLDDI
jgi:pSer/pThr/pTyr-binding forkhead associated (FHA) protein